MIKKVQHTNPGMEEFCFCLYLEGWCGHQMTLGIWKEEQVAEGRVMGHVG